MKKVKIRRIWKINPKTKIKQSEKKNCKKLTKKEIDKILREEDF